MTMVISFIFISASAYGWGRLLDSLSPRVQDREFTSTVLLGAGGMGTILTTIGIFWFTPSLVWTTVAIGFVVAAWAIYTSAGRGTLFSIDRYAVAITAIPCAVVVVSGFAEPLGDIGNDSISYHLLGPKVWLRHARIEPVLDHSHTAFPALIEVLYASAMVVGGPSTVGAVSALFFCLLCALVYETCLWIGGSINAARVAIALAATTGALEFTAGTAFIDVPMGCFILAGLRELFGRTSPQLLFAGAFFGFGVATKYTGLMWLAIASVVFAIAEMLSGKFSQALQRVAVVGVVACVVAGTWYVRNSVELGSPIVPPPPALASFFPVRFMPREAVDKFHEYIKDRGKGVGRSAKHFLLLPFTLTLVPGEFHCGAGIGCALLAFGPIGAYVVARTNRQGFWLLLFVLLQFIAWFVTQQEMRFLIPALATTCALAGIGAAWLWPRSGLIVRVLTIAIIFSSYGYGLVTEIKSRRSQLGSLASVASAERRRNELIPYRAGFDFLNETPLDSKVLILSASVPPYYVDREYMKLHGPYGEEPYGVATTNETLQSAASKGITHVMDVDPYQVGLDDSRMRLLFETANVRIFGLVIGR